MYHSKSIEREISNSRLDKKHMHLACKVDQFASQPFNKGSFGWPRNSVSAMAHAATYSEFLMIAQSLSKNPAKYNIPDGTSLKDAIAMTRPRMCQSPAELDLFAQQLADRDMAKMNEAYLVALRKSADEPIKKPAVDVPQSQSINQTPE